MALPRWIPKIGETIVTDATVRLLGSLVLSGGFVAWLYGKLQTFWGSFAPFIAGYLVAFFLLFLIVVGNLLLLIYQQYERRRLAARSPAEIEAQVRDWFYSRGYQLAKLPADNVPDNNLDFLISATVPPGYPINVCQVKGEAIVRINSVITHIDHAIATPRFLADIIIELAQLGINYNWQPQANMLLLDSLIANDARMTLRDLFHEVSLVVRGRIIVVAAVARARNTPPPNPAIPVPATAPEAAP